VAAHPSLHDDRPEGEQVRWLLPAWVPCGCSDPGCRVRKRSYVRFGRVQGLACDRPLLLVRSCGAQRVTVCDGRRDDKCGPCSAKHKRYLIRRAESGCHLPGYLYLLTLTAPGYEAHERLDPKYAGGWCNSRHRAALATWRKAADPRPSCGCALPAGGLADWNPTAGARWNTMRTGLARLAGDLEYLAVNEVQKRGALHKHILVRSDKPLDPVDVQRLALAAGFGCNVDLSPMTDARAAKYVAKYAAKGYNERAAVPWRGLVPDEDTGELVPMLTMARYRTVSQSRHWGLTLRQIRAAVRACVAASTSGTALVADTGTVVVGVGTAGMSALLAHPPPEV
jgi:hypothetical protein